MSTTIPSDRPVTWGELLEALNGSNDNDAVASVETAIKWHVRGMKPDTGPDDAEAEWRKNKEQAKRFMKAERGES